MHGLSAADCLKIDAFAGVNRVPNVQYGTYCV